MTSCTYQGDTTTYSYGYDGLRRSSTKDSVTTNYVYDGTNLVAEMRPNASGTLVVVTSYLLGAQGIEAKIDETAQTEAYYELNPTTGARLFDANNNLIVAYRGVTSWYVYDGHGNVVGTVNGVTGAYTANPTLDVYGVPRASGAPATKQGYCGSLGHVTDDTGLVYMRARYYDPNVGRFVSEDPSGNGANWYVYAGNNPVNMVDQTGKDLQSVLKEIFESVAGCAIWDLLANEGIGCKNALGKITFIGISTLRILASLADKIDAVCDDACDGLIAEYEAQTQITVNAIKCLFGSAVTTVTEGDEAEEEAEDLSTML
jgi:RHS repeat-associated protein